MTSVQHETSPSRRPPDHSPPPLATPPRRHQPDSQLETPKLHPSDISCSTSMAVTGTHMGDPQDLVNLACQDLQSQEEESFLYFVYGSILLRELIHLHNPLAVFSCISCLQVLCLGTKENCLSLEYQKKLNEIEPNDNKGEVSEEIKDIIKKREIKTHYYIIENIYGYFLYTLVCF
ncbi:gamma-glutamylcyclotransferase-like [Manis javanica]|uniref:gamma-glutamylcyclotransferase-like n=1 Tax=Manis javanica TaxID=9974 RepID=UPI001879C31A|nr:gamma-glutamylcyclotransferase-like [Manis javanica]